MSILPPEKVARLAEEAPKGPRIGTHDGQFHCDEVLACWLLRRTEKFKDAEIVRTRDPQILKLCDIVVDVGATYDPETLRLDHHQREFTGTFSPKHRTKLSSAGLVYKHFGLEILERLHQDVSKNDLETLYPVVYDNLIEEIDGVDNGVSCYPADLTPAYRVTTQLGQRVARLNPRWNDPAPDVNEGFRRAMEVVGAEFSETVDYYARCWLPARSIVAAALAARHETDPSGQIMLLEGHVPWKEHLFDLEVITAPPPRVPRRSPPSPALRSGIGRAYRRRPPAILSAAHCRLLSPIASPPGRADPRQATPGPETARPRAHA